MKKSCIKIPFEVIDEASNQELLLPLYVYLMMNVGKSNRIYTSTAYMLFQCGYNYNTNSKTRGHFDKLQDALQWLYDNEYIFAFEHPLNGNQFESVRSAKPTQHFNIKLTDKAIDVESSFVAIYDDEYTKLHSLFFEKNYRSYCKLVNLFCLILRKVVVKNNGGLIFYTATIDKIVKKKIAGCKATVYKSLSMLYDLELLHSNFNTESCKKYIDSQHKLPHIFVRHNENWETQLNMAISIEKKSRKKYLNPTGGDI